MLAILAGGGGKGALTKGDGWLRCLAKEMGCSSGGGELLLELFDQTLGLVVSVIWLAAGCLLPMCAKCKLMKTKVMLCTSKAV